MDTLSNVVWMDMDDREIFPHSSSFSVITSLVLSLVQRPSAEAISSIIISRVPHKSCSALESRYSRDSLLSAV